MLMINVVLKCTQIDADDIDFRKWYKTAADMEVDEKSDRFPPRFKLQINCINPSCTLNLKYFVCVPQNEKDVINLQLIIFIRGRQPVQGQLMLKLKLCAPYNIL